MQKNLKKLIFLIIFNGFSGKSRYFGSLNIVCARIQDEICNHVLTSKTDFLVFYI